MEAPQIPSKIAKESAPTTEKSNKSNTKGASNTKKPRGQKSSQGGQPTFKVVVRKLPSKDFGLECFTEALNNVIDKLSIKRTDVDILKFLEGKLSRKRGPVPGACFLAIRNPTSFQIFMSNLKNSTVPFLPEESDDCQPVVEVAVYQKIIERGRHDKYESTIESSSDYMAFCEQLNSPAVKVTSAEARLEAGQSFTTSSTLTEAEKDPKMSALVVYLREKGRKQMELKRLKRRAQEQDKPRSGRSGGSKEGASRPNTAPGKPGTGPSGKKSGSNNKSSGPRVTSGGSEKPKSMPKMTILQRKTAASDSGAGGQRPATTGNAPNADQAGARSGGGGKKGQGSNNPNKPKKEAANAPSEGDSVGRFKQKGEERKKKRSQMRSSNDPKQPNQTPPGV